MKTLKNLLLLAFVITFLSCDDKDDDPVTPPPTSGTLTVNFNSYFGSEKITSGNFNSTVYTNANGDKLTISKMRYLISNLTLHHTNGETTKISDYYLVDLAGLNPNTQISITDVPTGNYSSISFTFGFNETDNVDGGYTDLNSASWNWPAMLGGGYHFMQFDGKYGATGTENPFNYHMGTARVSMGVFEQNFFDESINGFQMEENTTIELKMDVAEWFKNPNTWDLETYNTMLMPNYDAQKLMHQNGKSVFSLGEVN